MTLSCEIPSEQMSIECIKFYNEQRLKELELQIKTLTKMYNDLNCSVSVFIYHLNCQIDENRKISRRVDEVIELIVKGDLKLENEIDELKNKCDWLKNRYDHKKPHKCLLCNGYGSSEINEKTADRLRLYYLREKPCNSCEGKGIIWG